MNTKIYTVLKDGESIYEIGRKLGMSSTEILEHNDYENDTVVIPGGVELHLPYEREIQVDKPINYEIFDKPRQMHVVAEEGTKKFSFANVEKWEDLRLTGPTYPVNSNIEVVAVAHVPIGDETAAYYMDALALGTDFAETGMPAYTVGFNHSQLEDGFIDVAKAPIPPARQKRLQVLIQSHNDDPSPELAMLPTTEIDYQTVEANAEFNKWKSTYIAFEDGPQLFVANETIWVPDYSGHRSDKELKATHEVLIAGTFIKDDVVLGRPLAAVRNYLWYGVPMTNLISEEELYNTNVTLAERAALPHGRLSLSERGVVALAQVISQTTRLKAYLSKKIKNNKEKK